MLYQEKSSYQLDFDKPVPPQQVIGKDWSNKILISCLERIGQLYGDDQKDKFIGELNVDTAWLLNPQNMHHWEFHSYFWQLAKFSIENFDLAQVIQSFFGSAENNFFVKMVHIFPFPEYFVANVSRISSLLNKIQKSETRIEYKGAKVYFYCQMSIKNPQVSETAAQIFFKLNELSIVNIFARIFKVKGFNIIHQEANYEKKYCRFTAVWYRKPPQLLAYSYLFTNLLFFLLFNYLGQTATAVLNQDIALMGTTAAGLLALWQLKRLFLLTPKETSPDQLLTLFEEAETRNLELLRSQEQLRKVENMA